MLPLQRASTHLQTLPTLRQRTLHTTSSKSASWRKMVNAGVADDKQARIESMLKFAMTREDEPSCQPELLREANLGLDLLLDGKFDEAVRLMGSRPQSPWHVLTLGMIGFLQAALGIERKDLDTTQATLWHAEQLATSSTVTQKTDFVGWWRSESAEPQIIQADALVLQAMCLVLSESKWAFISCAYKLNRMYRLCSRTFKEVLPGVTDGMSVDAIATWIDALYKSKTDFDQDELDPKRTSTSAPRWSTDIVCSYVVTAALYQKGICDCLFSLLPANARTLTNLLYRPSDRKTSLNMLRVASQHGTGVHSTFASLALVVFDTMTLQFSPWVAESPHRIYEAEQVLSQRMYTHPNAVIWRWFCAKLARARGDAKVSCDILKDCIEARRFHFPQAETVLSYDLLWSSFTLGDHYTMFDTALKLTTLNESGLATYLALAIGALKLMPSLTAEQEEILHDICENKMPEAVKTHQAMGHNSPGQKFVMRRLELWQDRLKNAPSGTRLADVITISPVLEIALHFNIFSECTPQTLTLLLRSLCEGQEKDGQTGDRALRSLLKGAVHCASGRYVIARPFLELAASTVATKGAYAHVKPLAMTELVALDLKLADIALASNNEVAWLTVLASAERKISDIAKIKHYDLNIRLGVRLQVFRNELATKREMVKAAAARLAS